MINNDEFLEIKNELDKSHDAETAKKALYYLNKYNLVLTFSIIFIITCFKCGAPMDIWQNIYLLERSMPYYEGENPDFITRLLYFCNTYIIENNYLLGRHIIFRDKDVKFLFKDDIYTDENGNRIRKKADHMNLNSGYGKKTPDFYFWLDKCIPVEYKFCRIEKFTSPEEARFYYKDGKHLHDAKVLVIYLEFTESFYIIDYENDGKIDKLNIAAPKAKDLIYNVINPFEAN